MGVDRLEGSVPVKALFDKLSEAKLGMRNAPYSTSPMFPAAKNNRASAAELHNNLGVVKPRDCGQKQLTK